MPPTKWKIQIVFEANELDGRIVCENFVQICVTKTTTKNKKKTTRLANFIMNFESVDDLCGELFGKFPLTFTNFMFYRQSIREKQ